MIDIFSQDLFQPRTCLSSLSVEAVGSQSAFSLDNRVTQRVISMICKLRPSKRAFSVFVARVRGTGVLCVARS